MTEQTKAVALPSEQEGGEERPTVGKMIQMLRPEMQRALPKGMDADRMARLATTVLRTTPALAECTPESFAGALLTASALGLEPGVLGEAYLMPYNNSYKDGERWVKRREVQLVIGYQGFVKLFHQSPLAESISAEVVYARDEFDFGYGTAPFLTHKPFRGSPDRGEVDCYYAVARLTNGAAPFAVFTPEEIKALRRGKEGPSGDIPDPQRWMERKTAIRQLTKLLPRSVSLAVAQRVDEAMGSELKPKIIVEQIGAKEGDES